MARIGRPTGVEQLAMQIGFPQLPRCSRPSYGTPRWRAYFIGVRITRPVVPARHSASRGAPRRSSARTSGPAIAKRADEAGHGGDVAWRIVA
jgi:hypothetical protein